MTATRAAEPASPLLRDDDRVEALARRVGERVVRVLREYDAAAVEEVFSDGLLNVMEAPEFAQSEKLRRVFTALENRAYLGELVGSVAGAGRVQVFIGHENQPLDMRDVVARPGPVRPAGPGDRCRRRPRADPDVLFPGDRHGPLRVRPHERTGGSPVCLTGSRTRAQERADEIDISPTALLAQIETLTAERDAAAQTGRRVPRGAPARARRVPELQAPDGRGAERDLGLAGEDLIRKVLTVADDFDRAIEARPASIADDPWFEGIAAIDRKLRPLLESEGVTLDRRVARPPVRPARARGHRQRPGHRTGPDGEIVEEVRRGYRLRDRVIRPALVAVATTTNDTNRPDPRTH